MSRGVPVTAQDLLPVDDADADHRGLHPFHGLDHGVAAGGGDRVLGGGGAGEKEGMSRDRALMGLRQTSERAPRVSRGPRAGGSAHLLRVAHAQQAEAPRRGGGAGKGAVGAPEQLQELPRAPLPLSDLDHGAHEGPHHVPQEAVGLDLEGPAVARLRHSAASMRQV